jgi:hypothetical protein
MNLAMCGNAKNQGNYTLATKTVIRRYLLIPSIYITALSSDNLAFTVLIWSKLGSVPLKSLATCLKMNNVAADPLKDQLNSTW